MRRVLIGAPEVPLLSVPLPVNPAGRYPLEELPMVASVDSTIKFVGGINKPKLVGVTLGKAAPTVAANNCFNVNIGVSVCA